jgi:hypothetical protein
MDAKCTSDKTAVTEKSVQRHIKEGHLFSTLFMFMLLFNHWQKHDKTSDFLPTHVSAPTN